MNSGRRRAGNGWGYLEKIFLFSKHYKKWYKSWDNLKSLNVGKGHGLVNCRNFGTFFCRILEMKIFIFDISSYPLPFPVRNSLTNQFNQKKIEVKGY